VRREDKRKRRNDQRVRKAQRIKMRKRVEGIMGMLDGIDWRSERIEVAVAGAILVGIVSLFLWVL
jgi:hypothetical protein